MKCIECNEKNVGKYGEKFCSRSCSVANTNRRRPKKMRECRHCKTLTSNKAFCKRDCQHDHARSVWIESWLAGNETGTSGKTSTSVRIKWYLKETRGNKCELCTWNKINKTTGNVPIELDHIDGDYLNNRPDNLRLLCPNCHALTPNFRALNKKSTRVR